MARTTIGRDLIALIKLGKADKERVLRDLAEASSGGERLRQGSPAIVVKFHILRKAPDEELAASGFARGTRGAREMITEAIYDVSHEIPLYRLTDAARVDVIRFGRNPDQDVQLLDIEVSREHGLVILADQVPLYCDYGTLVGGKHGGTTNGTHLEGVGRIRDVMIPWLPTQSLMIGHRHVDRAGNKHSSVKITYEAHGAQPAVGDPVDN